MNRQEQEVLVRQNLLSIPTDNNPNRIDEAGLATLLNNITFYGLADHTGALKNIQTRTACPAASLSANSPTERY